MNARVVFLAGGITGCPDWQAAVGQAMRKDNIVLLNPRQGNFDMTDPNAARKQIKWEYDHLRKANEILFWFPEETLCPIVLYELGSWSMTKKPIYVGVHQRYARKRDVEIQTSLVRPDVEIVYSLKDLVAQMRNPRRGI